MAAAQDEQETQGAQAELGPLGPIKLHASLHETIWGGRRLAVVAGKALPEGARIGEAWETALDSTALTPPHTGQSLGQLVETFGEALLGSAAVAVYGRRFPLLAKFLDANDWLSVQTHPDDAYAARHEGGKLGKTEMWVILAAEPGAQIVYGVARATTREEVSAAIAANALEPLLRTVDVHAGDVFFVPAGTVHAIGAGVTLYELQEYSDVTYRLYDYGRLQANGQPRELHVERALDVMRYTPSTLARAQALALPTAPGVRSRRLLVACRYFALEEVVVNGVAREPAWPTSCQILTLLRGEAEVGASGCAPVRLAPGETALLPATLGEVGLRSLSAEATLLRAYVPEPDDAGLARWRQAHDGEYTTV